MDNKGNQRSDELDTVPGLIFKSAGLEAQSVDDTELRLINKYTLAPVKAEDVYTFKAVLCDNELDRDYEQFTQKSLNELSKLFLGRTVIKDHVARADNQVARIYATEVVDTGKIMKNGSPYLQLVAKCYMIRTEKNADMIREIDGGIKKEGSISFRPSTSICSVCGTDNAKSYCPHWPGRTYSKDTGAVVCTFTLDGVRDAYEFSLVAIPAQRNAGVSKSYTGETIYEKSAEEAPEEPENDENAAYSRARARVTCTKLKNMNNI